MHSWRKFVCHSGIGICLLASVSAAQQSPLVTTGHINNVPYTIRHLPISSFPELPEIVAGALTRRGCLIPQTYEAHGPENVIYGNFERRSFPPGFPSPPPDSQDWAVLCSSQGTVSLLVFFAGAPSTPITLASAPETSRLSPRPGQNELGFDWGIDRASPERVHEAQTGLSPRPQPLTHDAIADSAIEQRTIYRYFSKGAWTQLPMP
jgi:hypothetical protein